MRHRQEPRFETATQRWVYLSPTIRATLRLIPLLSHYSRDHVSRKYFRMAKLVLDAPPRSHRVAPAELGKLGSRPEWMAARHNTTAMPFLSRAGRSLRMHRDFI